MTTRVVLTAPVLDAIRRVCAEETQGRETGGILLGHQHTDGQLTVNQAAGPGPRAEQTPSSFRRDPAHAGEISARAYARNHSVWLGDWHTHPIGPPYPSNLDLASYAGLVADPTSGFEAFLSIIVIPTSPDPLLWAWTVTATRADVVGLWVARNPPPGPRPDGPSPSASA